MTLPYGQCVKYVNEGKECSYTPGPRVRDETRRVKALRARVAELEQKLAAKDKEPVEAQPVVTALGNPKAATQTTIPNTKPLLRMQPHKLEAFGRSHWAHTTIGQV
jgi:hypothetical protein